MPVVPADSVTVATWDLNETDDQAGESVLAIGPLGYNIPDTESVMSGSDKRKKVALSDIKPGGKYYSIAKLMIRYERQTADDQRWGQGTGWLIQPDVLVTAGHCVYDHSNGLGRAVEIKVWLGYNGKDSIGSKDVQFRQGKSIATTKEWVASDLDRARDVGFVQVAKPFEKVVPFDYKPLQQVADSVIIGVVGYPADKTAANEKGAQMYEEYKRTNYDLRYTDFNMLEYEVSTYKGQSGSPVIMQGSNASVGAHVYGLGEKNSASVVKGHYGNDFDAHVQAFGDSSPPVGDFKGISYVNCTPDPKKSEESDFEEPEDFLSVLKNVVKVGSAVIPGVLDAGAPFLGPVGGPIASAVGTAIGFASKFTESCMSCENSLEVDHSYQEHASRAILAEAAFQAFLQTGNEDIHGPVKAAMQDVFDANRHIVPFVAQKMGHQLMEPALRLAVSATDGKQESMLDSPPRPRYYTAPKGNAERQFMKSVMSAAKKDTKDESESILSIVGSAISVAPVAIGIFKKLLGGESDLPPPHPDGFQQHMQTLCHRALFAEAALSTMVNLPSKDLEAEGAFGSIVSAIKTLAPKVIRVAPTVIRVVGPILKELIEQNGDANGPKPTETVMGGRPSDGGLAPPDDAPVRRKPSFADLITNGGSLNGYGKSGTPTAATGRKLRANQDAY